MKTPKSFRELETLKPADFLQDRRFAEALAWAAHMGASRSSSDFDSRNSLLLEAFSYVLYRDADDPYQCIVLTCIAHDWIKSHPASGHEMWLCAIQRAGRYPRADMNRCNFYNWYANRCVDINDLELAEKNYRKAIEHFDRLEDADKADTEDPRPFLAELLANKGAV